jgi:hypothetical protein
MTQVTARPLRYVITLLVTSAALYLLATSIASWVGSTAASHAADRSRERLELVWPSLMTMPQSDRALVVSLAMTCDLEARPARAADVIACLRSAVDDTHAIFPKGMDHERARARLDELLHEHDA